MVSIGHVYLQLDGVPSSYKPTTNRMHILTSKKDPIPNGDKGSQNSFS